MDEEEKKENFLFYYSWYDIITSEYSDLETQNKLFRAILQYGITGEKTYPAEKLFLRQVYVQIDSAQEKWENLRRIRSEAGRKGGLKGKGGAPKGNKNAQKQKQTIANNSKQYLNVNGNVNVNEKDNDNTINVNNTSYDSPPFTRGLPTRNKRLEDLEDGEWI